MILVDSSVWIDYFNGAASAETDLLDRLMDSGRLLVGDLILGEVLHGFRSERDAARPLPGVRVRPDGEPRNRDCGGAELPAPAAKRRHHPRDDRHADRDILHRQWP